MLRDEGRVLSDEPVAIAATAVATAATATNAKTGFDRLTQQSYRGGRWKSNQTVCNAPRYVMRRRLLKS